MGVVVVVVNMTLWLKNNFKNAFYTQCFLPSGLKHDHPGHFRNMFTAKISSDPTSRVQFSTKFHAFYC